MTGLDRGRKCLSMTRTMKVNLTLVGYSTWQGRFDEACTWSKGKIRHGGMDGLMQL